MSIVIASIREHAAILATDSRAVMVGDDRVIVDDHCPPKIARTPYGWAAAAGEIHLCVEWLRVASRSGSIDSPAVVQNLLAEASRVKAEMAERGLGSPYRTSLFAVGWRRGRPLLHTLDMDGKIRQEGPGASCVAWPSTEAGDRLWPQFRTRIKGERGGAWVRSVAALVRATAELDIKVGGDVRIALTERRTNGSRVSRYWQDEPGVLADMSDAELAAHAVEVPFKGAQDRTDLQKQLSRMVGRIEKVRAAPPGSPVLHTDPDVPVSRPPTGRAGTWLRGLRVRFMEAVKG